MKITKMKKIVKILKKTNLNMIKTDENADNGEKCRSTKSENGDMMYVIKI